jgi:hypothetical protein
VTRDPVADYLAEAKTFVSLVERVETADRERLVGDLAIALADLYSAAVRLPSPDVTSDELLSGGPEGSMDATLERVFGGDDFSWDSVDWEYYGEWLAEPYERWKVVSELANDVDEAFMDANDHIAMLKTTGSSDDATWQVRFEFWSHTSDHVIGAMRLFQAYLSSMGGPIPPPDTQ